MMSRAYPPLDPLGGMSVAYCSTKEIYLARGCGIIFSDTIIERIGEYVDDINISNSLRLRVRSKYFLIHLIDIYYRWLTMARPFWALESLIADFEDASTLTVGDGRLPSLVAGIGEVEEYSAIENFVYRARAQVFLSPYVVDAGTSFKEVLLSEIRSC